MVQKDSPIRVAHEHASPPINGSEVVASFPASEQLPGVQYVSPSARGWFASPGTSTRATVQATRRPNRKVTNKFSGSCRENGGAIEASAGEQTKLLGNQRVATSQSETTEACHQFPDMSQFQYFPNLRIIMVAGDGQLKHFSDNDLCNALSSRRPPCASQPP